MRKFFKYWHWGYSRVFWNREKKAMFSTGYIKATIFFVVGEKERGEYICLPTCKLISGGFTRNW